MTPKEGEDLIRQMLAEFTNFDAPVARLRALVTPDYRQKVDGRELDLAAFLDHALALRSALTRLHIDIEHIVSDGVAAATVHVARATKRSGERVEMKVVAFYLFRDGRVSLVDELSHLVHGREADETLGSTVTS
ncbi:nuclear transport factor 2 family protein [Xanthobacteraceae bacterium Astr-EGSB]|uniref:nuclear transport factor 2 family protein n=1 Tax=Astrobacterium formosum TaxID=3069710 RepID=UPI0027B83A40|nr:nuclear transport factor 2 family protein [Xanthobacteraceae bacterium Astr-EGSB]